jgi:hypothetical protein
MTVASKMISIWIGTHAIKQYAARVAGRDPETLTKDERARIQKRLLTLYKNSRAVTDTDRAELHIPGNNKHNQSFHLCTVSFSGKCVTVLLICGFDDAHNSQALKLITVIKLRERKADQ